MTIRTVLQVLLVSSLSICYNSIAVGGRRLSKEEDLDLEEQLKHLNKPSVKTIRTNYGDTYDCIDFYKQPAFDHPLLKKHNFHPQMKPTYTHKKIEEKSSTNSIGIGLQGESCPVGTVPIRRTTKDDLIRAKRYSSNIHSLSVDKPGVYHAMVRTKFDPNKKYSGAKSGISTYMPNVNASQYSSARMTIQNGPDFIQVGWTVNPPLYGDHLCRSFTFFKAGEISCYNTQCPGFVIVDTAIPLDTVYPNISNTHTQYSTKFLVYRDQANGNWWLAVETDLTPIGFWPQRIFTGLKDLATYIDWGGETYAPPGQPAPPMGSGGYLYLDTKHDAFFKTVMTVDESNHLVDPKNTEAFTEDHSLYRVKDEGRVTDYFGHLIFFGGPGQLRTK